MQGPFCELIIFTPTHKKKIICKQAGDILEINFQKINVALKVLQLRIVFKINCLDVHIINFVLLVLMCWLFPVDYGSFQLSNRVTLIISVNIECSKVNMDYSCSAVCRWKFYADENKSITWYLLDLKQDSCIIFCYLLK